MEEGLGLESKWRGGAQLGSKRSPKQVSWLVCQDGELFSSTCFARDSHNFGRRPQHMETSSFSIINTACSDSVASILEKVAFPALCKALQVFSRVLAVCFISLGRTWDQPSSAQGSIFYCFSVSPV